MLKNVKPWRIASGIHSSGFAGFDRPKPFHSPHVHDPDDPELARGVEQVHRRPAPVQLRSSSIGMACPGSSLYSARLFQ